MPLDTATLLSPLAKIALMLGILGTCEVIDVGQAHAVIGRPATPLSYAGVARRTSRRTTRRAVAATSAVAAGAISTLPAGCVRVSRAGNVLYNCAGTFYRPLYDGPTIVYVVDE
ncbi:MAG: hypothetical protein ACO3JL_07495 [Myxococcota bacterium]